MIQTPTASGMDGIKLQTPPLPLPLKGGELPTEFPLRQQFFGGQGGAVPMWRTRRRCSHVADKAALFPCGGQGGSRSPPFKGRGRGGVSIFNLLSCYFDSIPPKKVVLSCQCCLKSNQRQLEQLRTTL